MKSKFSIILVLGIVPLSGLFLFEKLVRSQDFIIGTIIIIQFPTNLNLLEGSVAYFPCTSDNKNVPFWRINGQLYDIQFLPNGFSFNTTGLVIDHVTLSQNGTTIQCVFSADVATDVAILTVYSSEESLVSFLTSQQAMPSTIAITSISLIAVTSNYYSNFEVSSYDTSITTSTSMITLSSSTQRSLSLLRQSSTQSSSITITSGVTSVTDTESFNNSLISIIVPIGNYISLYINLYKSLVITMTVIAFCVIGILVFCLVRIQSKYINYKCLSSFS